MTYMMPKRGERVTYGDPYGRIRPRDPYPELFGVSGTVTGIPKREWRTVGWDNGATCDVHVHDLSDPEWFRETKAAEDALWRKAAAVADALGTQAVDFVSMFIEGYSVVITGDAVIIKRPPK